MTPLELGAGAAAGVAAQELLKAVKSARQQIKNFKDDFERLQSTLELMLGRIDEMKSLYPDTPGFDDLKRKLDGGMMLIQRCLQVQGWNCFLILRCSKDIKLLDTDLKHFRDNVMQVEIFVAVGRLGKLDRPLPNSNIAVGSDQLPSSSYSNGHDQSSLTLSSSNDPDQFSFRNDASLAVYCEPNGVGKTTLPETFDLKLVLEATWETLWHDCSKHRIFGKSFLYHAAHKDVVIKKSTLRTVVRKDVPLHKAEFQEHMKLVGSIRHPNVVPVRAYYFCDSNEERVIVYDYYNKKSVHHMLHGKDSRPLYWDARLRIAIGVANGIACIHKQNDGTLVHGNIKSPNIFLNDKDCFCISDLGQSMLFPPVLPFDRNAHRHLAPEIITADDFRSKTTQASDIYSYGTLLMELSYGEINLSLFNCVGSSGIKDVHIKGQFSKIEKQWEEMKQIAKSCTSAVPEKRPNINHVLTMVKALVGIKNAGLSC